MEGKLTDAQFREKYPNARINKRKKKAVVDLGTNRTNEWTQNPDTTWTCTGYTVNHSESNDK